MKELQLLLESKLMIRRLKSDVISQLPPKVRCVWHPTRINCLLLNKYPNFRLFVLLRQMVILNPEVINSKSSEMKQCAKKLEEANLTGMERRGALLSYYCATGKSKLKAVQWVTFWCSQTVPNSLHNSWIFVCVCVCVCMWEKGMMWKKCLWWEILDLLVKVKLFLTNLVMCVQGCLLTEFTVFMYIHMFISLFYTSCHILYVCVCGGGICCIHIDTSTCHTL